MKIIEISMNTHKTILPAIIFILCHTTTFSMYQPHHQNSVPLEIPHQLPPISFYPVSHRDELWQYKIPNKHDNLFPYPYLFNDFIEKEPLCSDLYNIAFQKAVKKNVALLQKQNIHPIIQERYLRRLAAEQELTRIIMESASPREHQLIIPDFFHPQFHTVDTDEELKSSFFASRHGFYSYARPGHRLIDSNVLTNVYRATLTLNVDRAHYIQLDNRWIEKHITIILALLERYKYDLECAAHKKFTN